MLTIYGLVDCAGTIRYVGKTGSPKTRLRQHQGKRPWVAGLVVLEVVADDDGRDAERRHIAEWSRWGDLENRNAGGAGPTSHTPEVRAAMSAARRGNTIISAAQRARISSALMGNKHFAGKTQSPEARARISAALIGHSVAPESRAKMSAALRGRTISAEGRANMSASLRGRPVSTETRAKISAAHKGRTPTPEARANMSAGQRRRFAKEGK